MTIEHSMDVSKDTITFTFSQNHTLEYARLFVENSEQLTLLHLLQNHYKKYDVSERLEYLIKYLFRDDYGDIVINAINNYYSNENIIVVGTLEEYNKRDTHQGAILNQCMRLYLNQ
jgi:hypothetical protein